MKTELAFTLGQNAFHAGMKPIPALDSELRALIAMLKAPIGGSIPLLDAWLRGWHTENGRSS